MRRDGLRRGRTLNSPGCVPILISAANALMKAEFETQVAREGASSRHQARVNRIPWCGHSFGHKT
jgi:hypothetical protein